MERKRLDYLDIARGIGIFLVVLGHSITVGMARNQRRLKRCVFIFILSICRFFFIISGILFEKNKEKYALSSPVSYCGHKAAVFMIPYLIFSLLNYAIIYISAAIPFLGGVLSANGYHVVPLHETVLAIITFIGHQDNHLWFIYVMFFVLVINRVLLFKQTKLTYILLFILYFVSLILPGNTPILLTNTLQYLFFIFCRSFSVCFRLTYHQPKQNIGLRCRSHCFNYYYCSGSLPDPWPDPRLFDSGYQMHRGLYPVGNKHETGGV